MVATLRRSRLSQVLIWGILGSRLLSKEGKLHYHSLIKCGGGGHDRRRVPEESLALSW